MLDTKSIRLINIGCSLDLERRLEDLHWHLIRDIGLFIKLRLVSMALLFEGKYGYS